MPRIAEILAAIAGAVLALIVGAAILAYGVQGRSMRAFALEQYLWITDYREDGYTTPEDYLGHLAAVQEARENRVESEDIQQFIPDSIIGGIKAHSWKASDPNAPLVIYFPGGGFTNEATTFHFFTLGLLTDELGSGMIVPFYPLAPAHRADTVYPALTTFYRKVHQTLAEGRKIVVVGDSAGANVALTLTKELRDAGQPLPDSLILISPWVDLTLSQPDLADYEHVDPILYRPILEVKAKAWAGERPLNDPLVSPGLGELEGLPPTMVINGTRDLLYPDIARFAKRLEAAKVSVRYVEGQGMNHAYPILPIPESREAITTMVEWITTDHN